MNQTEREALDAIGELDKRPTAAQRTVRSGGQASAAYVVMNAAQAFNWWGVAHWSKDKTEAGMALAFLLISAAQNLGPKLPVAVVGVGRWVRGLRRATDPG